jgi:hypothetical protein
MSGVELEFKLTPSTQNSSSDEETVRNARQRAEVAKRFAEGIAAATAATRPVKTMSQQDSKSGTSSKLKKVGVTLIALPDPVTGAVGVPVLAAGYALEKLGNRELRIPELTSDLAKTMRELEKLRRSFR